MAVSHPLIADPGGSNKQHVSTCDPRDPPSVPDGGATAVLLGLGVLSLILVQKKTAVA